MTVNEQKKPSVTQKPTWFIVWVIIAVFLLFVLVGSSMFGLNLVVKKITVPVALPATVTINGERLGQPPANTTTQKIMAEQLLHQQLGVKIKLLNYEYRSTYDVENQKAETTAVGYGSDGLNTYLFPLNETQLKRVTIEHDYLIEGKIQKIDANFWTDSYRISFATPIAILLPTVKDGK